MGEAIALKHRNGYQPASAARAKKAKKGERNHPKQVMPP
jgi:hypothetical protein